MLLAVVGCGTHQSIDAPIDMLGGIGFELKEQHSKPDKLGDCAGLEFGNQSANGRSIEAS
ncbi:hypothetical protein BOS5A_80003 [Bosea sp. EC-HK365B]|nr:hypothetical protein BOSE21B_111397 [Bosea sp. 21B]CAD5270753.1 hypothetical protein BOSE7B_20243 [Bosea sp. 7B]VVT62343.1 hypothetical protein BOS5A_80003 [Bosea sp. EC-HK365B]VXC66804.1 hypothetical protein BOSE127_30259 [Bosea sp. 127]